ncbi:MAG: hypothetical protein R3C05_00875 [Pirellulaceae bacterium]
MIKPCILLLSITSIVLELTNAEASEPINARSIPAHDSLGSLKDASHDAADCLNGFAWSPASFSVTLEVSETGGSSRTVRFPSAIPTGDVVNDRVAMQWFHAKLSRDQTVRPAVIVVHESGSSMTIGRLFARSLSLYGVHAFLIHLPGYGLRKSDEDQGAKCRFDFACSGRE